MDYVLGLSDEYMADDDVSGPNGVGAVDPGAPPRGVAAAVPNASAPSAAASESVSSGPQPAKRLPMALLPAELRARESAERAKARALEAYEASAGATAGLRTQSEAPATAPEAGGKKYVAQVKDLELPSPKKENFVPSFNTTRGQVPSRKGSEKSAAWTGKFMQRYGLGKHNNLFKAV